MATTPKGSIITPGGPRLLDQVHRVGQGEAVARSADGTYGVVRKLRPDLARVSELLASGLYAFTPGGLRPKSMIHRLAPGEAVAADRGVFKKFNLRLRKFVELPRAELGRPEPAPAPLPALGSGWIAFGAYTEPAANVITSMTTTWTVPPEPSREDGQLIYLFNGLQDSPVTHILQPVLQWGTSNAGGGTRWSVASWFVDSSGNAFQSNAVDVNPGDVLTGVMRMLAVNNGRFTYDCEFTGIQGSNIQVLDSNQLVMPVETLEAYTVIECRDYPATLVTSMRSIGVNTAAGPLALRFTATDSVTDCGQHAIVASNATGAGQVDLYYSQQFLSTSPATVTSISRMPDQIDLFAVGTDGSVDTTFWNGSGWFGRWFRLPDSRFWDAFTVPPQSQISVLSRHPQHLDLFTVGRDAAVYSTFWDQNGGWPNNWFRLGDSNFGDGFTVPQQSLVTSLARRPDVIDLFVSGFDGGVYSTFWTEAGGWHNHWFRLDDDRFWDQFTVPPGTPVTAVSRFPEHIDLFTSGRDGHVYSTFWDGATGWSSRWFWLGDNRFWDGFTVPPGSPITAISRFPEHLDLFVSGRDGHVYSTFWDGASGWLNSWFWLGDDRFADQFTIPPGAPVTAISRFREHIDLFVAGLDGGVYSTFWDGATGWSNRWFRLGDSRFWDGFTIPPGARVTAQSRVEDVIDLFVTGRDNAVYSTFWTAQNGWLNQWFRL